MDQKYRQQMARIIEELRNAGYDPNAQLNEYVRTRDDRYITRQGNARKLIQEVDWNWLRQYVNQMTP